MRRGIYIMNTTAIGPELEGRTIQGRFPLQRWLGGSQGSGVYLTEVDGARQAAIKLVAAETAGAEIRAAGWAAAASLSHPLLIRVLHTGRCTLDGGEIFYVVTELADEVLSEILPQRPLTPEETREMLGPVVDALSYLHGQGFAHGHLKPSNILVVEDRLKLSADCISLAGSAGRQLPEPTVYDAPELSRGEISPAADVWSLGMTLVAALTQQAPAWESGSGTEPVVSESVPEPFASVARACLRLEPAERSALNAINARAKTENTGPENAARKDAVPAETNIPGTRSPSIGRPAVLIAAAVVLVGIVAAVLLHTGHTPSQAPVAEQPPAPAVSTASPPPSGAAPLQTPAPAATSAPPTKPRAAVALEDAENGAIANRVVPDVPAKALQTIHGKVVVKVRVQVDASGDVSDAESESPGASAYFTRLAVEAARGWKFAPSQSGTAASEWTLRFVFRPDGAEATADAAAP